MQPLFLLTVDYVYDSINIVIILAEVNVEQWISKFQAIFVKSNRGDGFWILCTTILAFSLKVSFLEAYNYLSKKCWRSFFTIYFMKNFKKTITGTEIDRKEPNLPKPKGWLWHEFFASVLKEEPGNSEKERFVETKLHWKKVFF